MTLRCALRADSGRAAGAGHVVRSIALGAAAIRVGWQCELVSFGLPPLLRTMALGYGIAVRDLNAQPGSLADADCVASADPDVVVVDGYWATLDYLKAVDERCSMLGLIDDHGITDAPVDFIVNQNPWALESTYSSQSVRALLGLQYALVRPEVREAALGAQPIALRQAVTLSMGGTDAAGLGIVITRALLPCTGRRQLQVAGGFRTPLTSATAAGVVQDGRVSPLQPDALPTALASSQLAVIAAGSTMWEAAVCGVPAIGLVVADNQEPMLADPTVGGFARVFDCRSGLDVAALRSEVVRLLEDHSLLEVLSEAGRRSVDGDGAGRVVDVIAELVSAKRIPAMGSRARGDSGPVNVGDPR